MLKLGISAIYQKLTLRWNHYVYVFDVIGLNSVHAIFSLQKFQFCKVCDINLQLFSNFVN